MKNDDTIIALKGPERVRRRPKVVFGDDGSEGALNAVAMLLDVFIAEATLGFCKKISISLEKDDSVVIESQDRGFVLDETECKGRPVWYNDFCDFGCPPREPDGAYYYQLSRKHNTLYGEENGTVPQFPVDGDPAFSLCAVQYCSEWMRVESVHQNRRKRLSFRKGYPVCELERERVSEPSYTRISFKLDREVFRDVSVSFDAFSDALRIAAIAVPGLNCSLAVGDRKATFFYPAGLADYVKELSLPQKNPPVFSCEIFANGKDRYNKDSYDARVRAAVAFVPKGGRVECLHNYRSLPDGGKHLMAAKKKIIRNLKLRYEFEETFDFEDIADHIVLVLETNCTARMTRWANREGTALGNRMIRDMSADAFGDDFDYFLKSNADRILPLFNLK